MKATIKIPKGWRRLRNGEAAGWADRVFNTFDNLRCTWDKTDSEHIGQKGFMCTFIRRIARAKKWAPKDAVEFTYEQWSGSKFSSHAFRYSDKTGSPLITRDEWMKSGIGVHNTRFWLRKGAK